MQNLPHSRAQARSALRLRPARFGRRQGRHPSPPQPWGARSTRSSPHRNGALPPTAHRSLSKATETYVGTLDTYGIDLGITGRTRMVWSVLAASFT